MTQTGCGDISNRFADAKMGLQLSGQRRLLWRILIYVATAVVLLVIYLGLGLLVDTFFPKSENRTLVVGILLIVCTAALLYPVQVLTQSILEGRAVGSSKAALPPMESILVKMAQAPSLDALAVELVSLLCQNMNVTFTAFALYSELKKTEGELRNFDYVKFEGDNKYEPLSRRMLFQPIQYFNTPELARSESDNAQTGVVMKLKIGEQQRGLLCLGPHLDGSEFKPADFVLLETLSGPVSVLVHSTFRIRDLERNIEELEKKAAEQRVEYDMLRRNRDELQLLNQKVVQDAEEERNKLVRELQSGPVSRIKQINSQLYQHSSNLSEREELIWHLAMETDKSLESITTTLRPTSLDKLGLVAALYRLVEDTRQHIRISIKLNVGPELEVRRLPAEIELSLYRVAQAALENVLEHAKAQHITISLSLTEQSETVRLAVLDDGVGFDPPAQFSSHTNPDRLGLAEMQERLSNLGGRLKVRSSVGAGAVIEAEVPLKRTPTP